MATVQPLKSILKRPSTLTATPRSREERNRDTALYHANLIQARKDVELQLLFSMEEMIDLPLERSAQYTASNPAASDVQAFKEGLQLFQPSDYDALIVERNINEHCGYTLCPKPRLKEEGMGRGKYRIIGKSGKAKDFRVVEKEELEKWCSEDCAKRALYIRIQLSERPAWERGPEGARIELMDEVKTEDERTQMQLANDLAKLALADSSAIAGRGNLALERGDRGARAASGLVGVNIVEKDIMRAAEAPSLVDDMEGRLATMHLELEGYNPRFGTEKEDDDDDDGMDWKI